MFGLLDPKDLSYRHKRLHCTVNSVRGSLDWLIIVLLSHSGRQHHVFLRFQVRSSVD
jgi:hypothetical protein